MSGWLLALLVAGLASEPDARDLSAWSESSVEAVPDSAGEPDLRATQRLHLSTEAEPGVHVLADGGLRVRRSPYERLEGELYRLSVVQHGPRHTLTVGRFTRLDARGLQRLDGAAVDGGRGSLAASAWLGHQWHPETWQTGEALVAGAQVHLRPVDSDGEPSRTQRLTAGWEVRGGEGLWSQRGHLAWTAHGPRGAWGAALAEVGLGDAPGLRTSVRGTVPAGRDTDVGFEARWEDLAPTATPDAVRTPMDWLAPEGYGIAATHVRWHGEGWSAAASGGASWHPRVGDDVVGGLGRAGVGWTDRRTSVDAFGLAAGIGSSWLGGGGGRVRWETVNVSWDAEAGAYWFQPLDGAGQAVWEARVRADAPVASQVTLRLDVTTGATRKLDSYLRGGVSLVVGSQR